MLPALGDLPSPNNAARIAQSLLNGFGVLSGEQWTHSVTDAGGVAVSCTPGANCIPIPATVTARMVTFDLVVDGVSVPDVSWSVTIGAHGSIESVWGTWARPESAGTYRLRSTQRVFDDLRSGNARYVGPQPLPAIGAPAASVTPGSQPAIVVTSPACPRHGAVGRCREDTTSRLPSPDIPVPRSRHGRIGI